MFRFSLQVALDVRSRQEKVKMKELAEALAVENSIINEINQIHLNIQQADDDLNNVKKAKILSIDQMRFLSTYKDRMKVVLSKCHQRLIKAQKKVKEQQTELIEASKARKTLEILKEKELKRFKEKISRIQQKSMDEIAGNLFIRQQKAV